MNKETTLLSEIARREQEIAEYQFNIEFYAETLKVIAARPQHEQTVLAAFEQGLRERMATELQEQLKTSVMLEALLNQQETQARAFDGPSSAST